MGSDQSQPASIFAGPRFTFAAAILTCLVAAVCYQSDRLVYVLGIPPNHIASFWPATSFLVAVLLLVPEKTWPVLIAAGLGGMALGDLRNGVPLRFEMWISLGNLGEVMLATWGIRRLIGGMPRLNDLKMLGKYLAFAVILVPFASALVGSNGSVRGTYWLQWRVWFFADALAFLTVTPAIWSWAGEGRAWARNWRNWIEAIVLVTLLVFFGYQAFLRTGQGQQPALLYSLVPLLLWAALRLGLKGVSTSMLVVTFLSIWGVAHGRGPFAQEGSLNSALSLQLFLFFAALPFTFLAVLVDEQKRAGDLLRESEQRFRLLANTAPVMIWISGPDKLCTYFNKAWLDFTGRSLHDDLGDGWAAGVHPDDLGRCLDTYCQAFDRRESFRMEYRLRRFDGEYRWVLDVGVPRQEDGSFAGYIGSAVDVSDQKMAELELRSRGEILARAEELANLGSWQFDLKTNTAKWSDNMYRILGFEPGEVQANAEVFWAMVSKEDRERMERLNQEAFENRRPAGYELRCSLANGQVRVLSALAAPVFSANGELIGVLGTSQDVTERRNEEDRLRRSEALLAQAEELANMGSWEWNLETSEVTWSDHRYRLTGMKPGASPPTIDDFWRLLHPDDRERVHREVQQAITGQQVLDYEARFVVGNGQVRVVHTRGVPGVDSEGRTIRLTGMTQDITEETLVKRDLQRLSQELLRTQDSERRQLARDLHESAGQTLAALKMTLANLEDALPERSDEARKHLNAARGLAEDAVREVRLVSYLMYPPLLDDMGLAPALSWYVRGFSERSGIKSSVEIPGDFGRHPQEIETTIFRIVQEALTNVHRYSASPVVRVRLAREAGQVRAEIHDEGCGLPIMSREGPRAVRFGVGIAGMRERVAQLNGTFEITSTPGSGTTVRVILPVRLNLT